MKNRLSFTTKLSWCMIIFTICFISFLYFYLQYTAPMATFRATNSNMPWHYMFLAQALFLFLSEYFVAIEQVKIYIPLSPIFVILIAPFLLLIGSFGMLMYKNWGRVTIKTLAFIALFYILVKLGMQFSDHSVYPTKDYTWHGEPYEHLLTSFRVFSTLFSFMFFGLLAWIIAKLSSKDIIQKFK